MSPMRPESPVSGSLAFLVLSAAVGITACASYKPPKVDMVPIGTNAPDLNEEKYPANKPPTVVDNGAAKGCAVSDTEEIADWLKNDKCKIPASEADRTPGLSQKLDFKLTGSTPEISPGGRVDLTLTIKNKSTEQVALVFNVDGPVFQVQTFDAKGKRLSPSGKPKAPTGVVVDEDSVRTVKLLVGAGATLKTKLFWDAVKLKWAPEKIEGPITTIGTFPVAPAGNLPIGKYSVRLGTSLNGVGDENLPRVPVEVVKE